MVSVRSLIMFRCLNTLRGFLHRQTLGFGTICNLSEWFCISVHRNGNGWFPHGKKFLLFQSQFHSVIQVHNKLELGAFGSERSIFLLNPGSTCAGAFTEADQTREGDDYIGGVVQAVQGLSGHDEAIPG